MALGFRAAERLVRVLAMQVDQKLADGLELGQRRRAAVDLRAASTLRIEHAAQQQRAPVPLREIVLPKPRARGRRVVEIEFGGDFGAIGARAKLARLEAVAEQQRKRIEQQRFAGARLAGQHGEAAVELDLERFDHGEVSDG